MAQPYAVPFCSVVIDSTYEMLDKFGYSSLISLRDAWLDVVSNLQLTEEDYKKLQGSYQLATPETLQADLGGKLKDISLPTIWLEQNTGTLCLRPLLFFSTICSLEGSVKWKGGNESPSNTSERFGVGSEITYVNPTTNSSQPSQADNVWIPLTGADYMDGWYERPIPATTATRNSTSNVIQVQGVELGLIGKRLVADTEEHLIQSQFKLEKNASFAISIRSFPKAFPGYPKNKPSFFRVYWGKKHMIQFDETGLKYSYNGWTQEAGSKELVDITGVSTNATPSKDGSNSFTLVVQVISNAIVINNVENLAPTNAKSAQQGWAYLFKDAKSIKDGLTVPEDYMYCGMRGQVSWFSYIPVYYAPTGKFISQTTDTGVALTGVETETSDILNGGSILITTTTIETTKFKFEADLTRNETVINTTPQLLSIELKSPPTTTQIGINTVDLTNRVRNVQLSHGIFDQSGTVVVDNRDGFLKNSVGVFPVTIETGWYRAGGSLTKSVRFRGFITQIQIDKQSAPYSTATLSLVGRSLQLKDAIAVNLPIYDGEIHTNAITSLLDNAGWAQPRNFVPNGTPYFTDETYRLSIPAKPGDQPLYMFSLGQPIWGCIEEIARPTGYWSYVDSKGVFNYVPPFRGNPVMTYKEVPSGNFQYDEWMSLSAVKETQDIRNAVIVVGLDASFEKPQYLTSVIKAKGGVGFGDPTAGVDNNFVPWLRWVVVQDGKLNDKSIVDWVAKRIFDNNNRPRWTTAGRVWGNPSVFPLDTIKIDLQLGGSGGPIAKDQIGIPQGTGGEWRVLIVNEAIDAESKTYTMDITTEWIDPNFGYAAWWGRN